MRELVLLAAILPLASPAMPYTESGAEALTVYNRSGGSVSISSLFDGENYSIDISLRGRGGSLLRDFTHSDGYQETVRAVHFDDDGNVYLAGVRYWQGSRYLWAVKYDSTGRQQWEWSDDTAGCSVGDIAVGDAGDLWVGGQCSSSGGGYSADSGGYALRLARVSGQGYSIFARTYDGPSSAKVRGLDVDFAGRASLTALTGDAAPLTIVVDPQGRQLATY